MKTNTADLSKELKKYFGFSTFKGQQEEIIKNLLEGKDIFVLMPTGGRSHTPTQNSTVTVPLHTCIAVTN